jgi:hypothetical protein
MSERKQKTVPRKPVEWTVMIYFAVDDPGQPGMEVIRKFKLVGSSPKVTFLAHVDPEGLNRPKSYYLQKDTKLDEDMRYSPNGAPRDPAAFRAFLKWGFVHHPAKNYMLVIWGHGNGWQGHDITGRIAGSNSHHIKSGASHPQVTPGQTRPEDLLDCKTLAKTLRGVLNLPEVVANNPKKKIDILGVDSCLMAMAEVGYQLRESVSYLIACEEVEPIASWPYDYIFMDLVQYYAKLGPRDLVQLIVRKYIISYKHNLTYVTQSVLDLGRTPAFRTAVKGVAKALEEALLDPDLKYAVMKSRALVQHYFIEYYVDLYDFCHVLRNECKEPGAPRAEQGKQSRRGKTRQASQRSDLTCRLVEACEAVMHTIQTGAYDYRRFNEGSFVPVHGLYGFPLRYSYGASIYFPCRDLSDRYLGLDFAKECGWGSFLTSFAGPPVHFDVVSSPGVPQPPFTPATRFMLPPRGVENMGPVVGDPVYFPNDPFRRGDTAKNQGSAEKTVPGKTVSQR